MAMLRVQARHQGGEPRFNSIVLWATIIVMFCLDVDFGHLSGGGERDSHNHLLWGLHLPIVIRNPGQTRRSGHSSGGEVSA